MKKEGVLVDDETLNRLSPYITQHINRYGEYWLDLNRQSPPINYHLSILSYWEKAGCPLGRIKIRLITGSRIRILADFVRIVLGVQVITTQMEFSVPTHISLHTIKREEYSLAQSALVNPLMPEKGADFNAEPQY